MTKYAKRNLRDLGVFYPQHMDAMTEEGLHDKSDIAAELAFRDKEIAELSDLIEQGGLLPKCESCGSYAVESYTRPYQHDDEGVTICRCMMCGATWGST